MKKILFVNTTYGAGGAPRVARDLFDYANSLPDHEAHYAYGRGRRADVPRVAKISYDWEVVLHAFLVRFAGIQGFGTYFSTRRLIAHIRREKFDVIHLHNIHGYYLNFGALFTFLKRAGIPVVWTLHDEWAISSFRAHTMGCAHCKTGKGHCTSTYTYPQTYVPFFLPWLLKKKKEWFTGVPNLTLVLPAAWLAKSVKNSFLGSYPQVLIPNGVDVDVFKPVSDKNALHAKYSLPVDKKIVLFSAHRLADVNKGTAYVLEAARLLRDKPYLFVGVGGGDVAESGNVRSLGQIDDAARLAELYALSDVFCFPTLAETAPLSALEAMSCGLPVVGFTIPALQEVVNGKTGILVPERDSVALANALEKVLDTEGLKEEMGRTARKMVEEGFSKKQFLEGYSKFYH